MAPGLVAFVYAWLAKRTLDVLIALAAIVATSPVWLVAAVAIWLGDRGPVIFRQQRVGRNGTLFTIRKFRSLPVGTPQLESRHATHLKPNRVGRILRRTNLDELPQAINILRGDMSVVGPRPPIPAQTAIVEGRRANGALAVRPGVTGLAQVNGRNDMSDEEKVELDGKYAADIRFWNDVALMVRTVAYIIRRPPAY